MEKYDFLIVGAGLYGAVFAREATKRGKKCLVIDKRNHIGGNVYCKNIDGINVHWYGAHIFHTSDKKIWDYVNSFVEFNRYTNSPLAKYKDELYNLPFNMNTFHKLWGVTTPDEAKTIIDAQIKEYGVAQPENLEEQALSLVGRDIYEKLIKGYTEKQWGRKATQLPAFIIKRIPLRYNFDNNYFNDTYQGIPTGGYTKLVGAMLEGIEVKLNCNFLEEKKELTCLAEQMVYTGKIDEFFDYKFGELEYRSLNFKHEYLEKTNFQGNAVVNYTEAEVPYTRIIEHKHFEFGKQATTVITYEFPVEGKGNEPYYPVNDEKNNSVYKAYKELAKEYPDIIFGGRLAEYKYYDMHQIIGSALHAIKNIFKE
ncbi:MAG TPA: UDP-galactopyranose mutase [Bacteroidia bacterium]|jgi:UDP-galactopyranose mutase|nr:UDP-galactopyranose mutase [Bacteroidia bacterium]